MFNFSCLTSNKTKIIYIVTYIIYEGLYLFKSNFNNEFYK